LEPPEVTGGECLHAAPGRLFGETLHVLTLEVEAQEVVPIQTRPGSGSVEVEASTQLVEVEFLGP
jgi:hypothetical protein